MALASFHVEIVSHTGGRFAVAAAAYNSGTKLRNEYTGQIHDYTRKRGIIFSAIFTPDNAPDWAEKQEPLWNQHQKADIKKMGSSVMMLSLPGRSQQLCPKSLRRSRISVWQKTLPKYLLIKG